MTPVAGTARTRRSLPLLSKSRYTAGLQCLKRLSLQCYSPDLATPAGPGQEAVFDAGTEAGALARSLFPGGVLVDEDYLHHREAVTRTRALLDGPDVPALYEAAFTEDSIRIRADILVRRPGGWQLVEVKSATSAKDQYLDDVAVQLHVLEQAGLRVELAAIAYLNRDYVYEGGEHDIHRLFVIEDVTEAARERLLGVPEHLAEMRAVIAAGGEPDIDIGAHCKSPYECEFSDYCRRDEPEWPVDSLPRIASNRVAAWRAAGHRSLLTLPAAEKLTEPQQRARQAVLSGEPWVSGSLARELERLVHPAHFIDFETVAPWLPRWRGTRPYQTLPFQWSDHMLHDDGRVEHAEFLADGGDDPRQAFALSLVERIQGGGSLVTYSSYEHQQLRSLREALPGLAPVLDEVLALPHLDLLRVVQGGYYHRDFGGSFSLKAILPVMVPDLGYHDLAIQKGDVASLQFQQLWNEALDEAERLRIRADLLAYCKRDTEAMVGILAALRAAVARG
jgi:hypothetical protein